jgi:hypothetical protein
MKKLIIYTVLSIISLFNLYAQQDTVRDSNGGIIMKAMRDELQRNMSNLEYKNYKKPFFISYSIEDVHSLYINATLGAITTSDISHNRDWRIRVIIGDYKLTDENFEEITNSRSEYSQYLDLPLDNDYYGIRRFLWEATDRVYKSAVQTYRNKITTLREKNITPEDLPVADFSRAPVIKRNITIPETDFNKLKYENIARELSSLFKDSPEIFYSDVSVLLLDAYVYFINSEGTEIKIPFRISAIAVNAQTMDNNSEPIADQILYYFSNSDDMPDLGSMKKDVENLKSNIISLRHAKVFDDTYYGPALITDQAVAQLMAGSLFAGHINLIAYREPLYSNAQMAMYYGQRNFSNESKIDKRILSRDISVTALPGLKNYGCYELIGSFEIDAEGVVPPEKLKLIEDGILKTLLNGRIPTKKIKESNGHNRFAILNGTFTRQIGPGVIKISGKNLKSRDELKKELIKKANEDGLDYAIIVRPVLRGVNYRPVNIYKVSVKDGKEELLRSVNIGDININSLKRIFGISDNEIVYNTMIPENIGSNMFNSFKSGEGIADGMPVSFIVPDAILLDEVEMEITARPLSNNLPIVDNPVGK